MKLYDQLLDLLAQQGVKQIFGIPGDAINPLIEALRNQDKIQFIHVTHEETGAFAASAQAKLTGELAVCAGTVGPGAIHLLNGLYDAQKDHAPVLAITGQVPRIELGFEYHQEVNLDALFQDVAVFHQTVTQPDQMPRLAIEACNAAIYRRGVAVLTIPHDVGSQSVEAAKVDMPGRQEPELHPAPDQLDKALQLIDSANKVTILYGEGCRYCKEELLQLAEHLSAPIVFSLKAKDIVPYEHELVAGNVGLLGSRGGVKAMSDCDLLLTLGSDFPYREWYPQNVPIVHIDRDPSVFGRRMAGEVGVAGDCKTTIALLIKQLKPKASKDHLKAVHRVKSMWNKGLAYLSDTARSTNLIHPQALARIIGHEADDNAIFTCDTGAVTVWGARHLMMRATQRFTCSFNLASMAYALPAAIGAQLRFPERQVISLSGDGGFNMLMGDLLTAVKYSLPIKVFIFNNGKLGLIKMEQEVEGYPEHETDLLNPDYAALARSFGASGEMVTDPAQLQPAVSRALKSDGPFLLDVHVNPNEMTLPPKIELAQAWGFVKSKLTEGIMHLWEDDSNSSMTGG